MKRVSTYFLVLGLSVLVGGLCSTAVQADEQYAIEIKPTKKVIHIEQLGLPANTSVQEVLEIMPELLNRGGTGNVMYENYSIRVDGKDVSVDRDKLIEQTLVDAVDVIEISSSPTASEQKNGQGGVINIKLRPVAEGFSGDAIMDVGTDFSKAVVVHPMVYLNYKKNNLVIRGNIMMGYERSKYTSFNTMSQPFVAKTVRNDSIYQEGTTDAPVSYRQESARFFLNYSPSQRDQLKFWLWESFESADQNMAIQNTTLYDMTDYFAKRGGIFGFNRICNMSETNTKAKVDRSRLSVVTNAEYIHKYAIGGELNLEFGYNYAPEYRYEKTEEINQRGVPLPYFSILNNAVAPHELSGTFKSKHPLLATGNPHQLKFEYGVNTTYNTNATKQAEGDGVQDKETRKFTRHTSVKSLYASPYFQFDYTYGPWYLQFGARYQYFGREVRDVDLKTFRKNQHDVTANVSLSCQVAPNHNLRLLGARNIVRPGDLQLYDYMVFNSRTRTYVKGNSDLRSTSYYNVDLNYIYNLDKDKHKLITNISASYIYVIDVVTPVTRWTGVDANRYSYITYINDGNKNVTSLNASVYYSYDIFSMAFAGNVYGNFHQVNGVNDYHAYYNLNLSTIFSFKHHWMLSGQLMYNSAISTSSSEIGDCFYAKLRVAKTIGQWNIQAELVDVFEYVSVDKTYLPKSGYATKTYDKYHRLFKIGFSYKF